MDGYLYGDARRHIFDSLKALKVKDRGGGEHWGWIDISNLTYGSSRLNILR